MSILKLLIFCLLIPFVQIGCSNKNEQAVIPKTEDRSQSKKTEKINDDKKTKLNIAGNKGLVVFQEKNQSPDKFIRIYNEDGSLWYKFTFYSEENDGKFAYAKDDFRPMSFHPDYFILTMRCIEEKGERYKVIVNEDTGLEKFVQKENGLKFETWGQHILNLYAVDFNHETNPIFISPDGELSKKNTFSTDVTFNPLEIKGEWLKIGWEDPKSQNAKSDSGWIKWKEKNSLVIEFFYIS